LTKILYFYYRDFRFMRRCLLCLRWFAFSLLLGSCQCGNTPVPTSYHPYIYYQDSNGKDLLDPANSGAFTVDSIKVNGNSASIAGFMITNTSAMTVPGFPPKGYALTFQLIPAKDKAVISLGKKISDTLYYSFSSSMLVNCKYNRMAVLPPGGSTTFPLQFPVSVHR